MSARLFALLSILVAAPGWSNPLPVTVVANENGAHLEVNGAPYFVKGMNWGYMPIGQNYSYDFWSKDDAFIEEVLHREMGQLKRLGVNSIRLFSEVPPRWVEWMYDNYQVRVALNHLMGRYGFQINGVWTSQIDYANPIHRKAILDDLEKTVRRYTQTRGVLMWLLGNENNYGLHWTSFEIEPLPGQEDQTRAVPLYTLMEEAAKRIKKHDLNRPVSLTNGDLQYLELIVSHCPSVDIFGSNVYRGPSARDFYARIWKAYKKPALFTEFGADAFNARTGREDALMQAQMLEKQWLDIYQNTERVGGARNAIGGFVFQWSDGWWKYKQEENLDIHDTNASWPNGGYPDFVEGRNNMNEEWFGINAKGFPDAQGHYDLYPRTAYYTLQQIWQLDPYVEEISEKMVSAHFDRLNLPDLDVAYTSIQNRTAIEKLEKIQLSEFSLRLSSNFSSRNPAAGGTNDLVFDHTESFIIGFQAKPTSRTRADLSLNVVGNVAQNRLNPIFYENRGNQFTVIDTDGERRPMSNLDRVRLYRASFEIDETYFKLDGYYRTGHYHWGNEGDLFGLYRNAYYGENIDIYNGVAPFGMVFTGRRQFDGLKVALGPELYWGANPSVIGKYRASVGGTTFTIMHQEDLSARAGVTTSSVVPEPRSRKTTVSGEWSGNGLTLHVGGIMAGTRRLDRPYYETVKSQGAGYQGSGIDVYKNTIQWADTFGVRSRIEGEAGGTRVHVQGSYMGLVADGGPDGRETNFTLTESGRGNHYAVEGGLFSALGLLGFGPKILYQKPLVGPIEPVKGGIDTQNGIFYPSIPLRNILDDPFVVRENRETIAGQLTLVFDPTPASWFFMWDRNDRETGPFAMALRSTYWHRPTAQDARVGIFADGVQGPFGASVPARDSWRVDLDWVANISRVRLFGNNFIGLEDAWGEATRQVFHFGSRVEMNYEGLAGFFDVRFNDWGPYDYHRDFNLTYPFQLTSELSWGVRPRRVGQQRTRIGVRGIYRQLDIYSEGYADPESDDLGIESEVRTFVEFTL